MFPTTLSCLLLLILTSFPLSRALVNITIDEQDSRISYVPRSSWILDTGVDSNYGGAKMHTDDPNAYATITLRFVSFYVLASKWPYKVKTDIEIDGSDHLLVDMQDYNSVDVGFGPSTVSYSVVASWIRMTSDEHTLRFSIPAGGGYAVIDAIIFEALDDNIDVTTSSTTSSTTATSTSDSSGTVTTSPSGKGSKPRGISKILKIVLGVIGSVLAILFILVFWFCCLSKSQAKRSS